MHTKTNGNMQTQAQTNTHANTNIKINKHNKIYIKQIQYQQLDITRFDCLFIIDRIYKTHSEINISVNK